MFTNNLSNHMKYNVALSQEKNVIVKVSFDTFHLKELDEYNIPNGEYVPHFEQINNQWVKTRDTIE